MGHFLCHKEFLELVRTAILTKEEVEYIDDAYNLSKYAHRTQVRESGERYFEHPKCVAVILMQEFGVFEPEVVVMALLHDIIEDTFILSSSGIQRLFGARVASGLLFLTKTEGNEAYVRRMSTCNDPGVIVVKLADRLHNMRTLGPLPPAKQARKVVETRELYLPLANQFRIIARGVEREALTRAERAISDICFTTATA